MAPVQPIPFDSDRFREQPVFCPRCGWHGRTRDAHAEPGAVAECPCCGAPVEKDV